MKPNTTQTLRFENADMPGRPLKLSATDNQLEIRLGDMGLTDVTITLTTTQAARLTSWLMEVTR